MEIEGEREKEIEIERERKRERGVEDAEEKIQIKLLNNKQFYENFNLNFSLQNKKLQQFNFF